MARFGKTMKAARKSGKTGTRKVAKKFSKGSASKTRKGKKDFTTKKTSKCYDRAGRRSKHARGSKKSKAPYGKGKSVCK